MSGGSGNVTLRGEGLHARHAGSERDALRDAWIEVRAGEVLVLVGPNGSGKSTLLATLARELEARQGRIAVLGREGLDREGLDRSGRAWAREVARLPQEPLSPPGLTVEQLVERGRYPHRGPWAALTPDDRAAVNKAIHLLDLGGLRSRPIEQLSGGERRRVWLALVLAQEARVLLLDEPLAGLDLAHRYEVAALLRELARGQGKAVLVVMHDIEEALWCADRVAVIHRGRVYASGSPVDTLAPETLRDIFGLDARVDPAADGPRLSVRGLAADRRFL